MVNMRLPLEFIQCQGTEPCGIRDSLRIPKARPLRERRLLFCAVRCLQPLRAVLIAAVNSKLDGLSIDTKETDAMLACFAAERRIVKTADFYLSLVLDRLQIRRVIERKDSIDDEGVPIPQAQLKPGSDFVQNDSHNVDAASFARCDSNHRTLVVSVRAIAL